MSMTLSQIYENIVKIFLLNTFRLLSELMHHLLGKEKKKAYPPLDFFLNGSQLNLNFYI